MATFGDKNRKIARNLVQTSSTYYLSSELVQDLESITKAASYSDLHALPERQPNESLADKAAELTTLAQQPTDYLPAAIERTMIISRPRTQIVADCGESLSINIRSPYDFLLTDPDPFNPHDAGTDFPDSRGVYLRVLGLNRDALDQYSPNIKQSDVDCSNDDHQTHDQGNERILAHWFLRQKPALRPPWAAPPFKRPDQDGGSAHSLR